MCEHIIGLWYDRDNSELVTLRELCRKIREINYCRIFSPKLDVRDFLNEKQETRLNHFKYCPICGEKLDWKGMRENATKN